MVTGLLETSGIMKVTSQIFCNLSEPCLLARSFFLHGQISSAGDPLLVDLHRDGSDQAEKGFLFREHAYNPGSPSQSPIDPLHHLRGSDPFPVLFWECRATHEPREESLDGVGGFPVLQGMVTSQIFCNLSEPCLLV